MNEKIHVDVAVLEAALEYERRRVKIRKYTCLGGICFGILFAFTVLLHGVWIDAHPRVPDVSGTDQESASEILADTGFRVTIQTAYSDTAEEGQVISQSPQAAVRAPLSGNIVLTVSKGKEPVILENVVGLSEEAADEVLTNQGFMVTIRKQFSDTVLNGLVISQSPEAGESIIAGEEVLILVSKGAEGKSTGNLVGSARDDAEKLLISLGFPYRIEEAYADADHEGKVTAQSWNPDELLYYGRNVTDENPLVLTVGKKQETVSLPDIYGLNADQAQSLLESEGFAVVRSEEYSGSIGKNYVISMTPESPHTDGSGNAVIYKGDTIHLVVSLGRN